MTLPEEREAMLPPKDLDPSETTWKDGCVSGRFDPPTLLARTSIGEDMGRRHDSATEKLVEDRLLVRMKNPVRSSSLQVKVYNFLERPTGWKCFIYHFTV